MIIHQFKKKICVLLSLQTNPIAVQHVIHIDQQTKFAVFVRLKIIIKIICINVFFFGDFSIDTN